MQAIILAAGMGRRLKSLTANHTKFMLKVNGVTLAERALSQLDKLNLSRIILVVGYESQKLKDYISTLSIATPIEYIENPIYDQTNNIYSLYLAKDALTKDDTILLESDLIFEDGVLRDLIDDPRKTLALVNKYECWMDGTVVKIDSDDRITSFIPGKQLDFNEAPDCYKTVNIYKFSKDFSNNHYVPFLEAYSTVLGNNEYYEQVLKVIALVDDSEMRAKRLEGRMWYEIDDLQDLDIAESMFAPSELEKLRMMQGRYGGYWRYPKLIDFCYLVNPYFPSQRLMNEMKASFETLLTQYPSGMHVNSLLAAKNFGVMQEKIVVGNGASELIKALMDLFSGNIGFVRPTFEEYPNRYDSSKSISYVSNSDNFSYSVDDLINYFTGKELEALILINPDNPSGNYLEKAEVERIMAWAEGNGVRLVYDESFADFAAEIDNSFLNDELLERFPHAVVIKSISKSYGVPGIRLGVLATADSSLLMCIRKNVGIWNVNSFGEFYLQIAEKYKSDYAKGLDRFYASRSNLYEELNKIDCLRVIPSQANYFMLELLKGHKATDVTIRLLCEENILVKDLSEKIKLDGRQFLRVAIRNDDDNDKLISALKRVLES